MRRCFAWPVTALALCLLVGCQPHGLSALRRGDELRRAGHPLEAIPLLLQATTDLPNEPRAWNFLGLAYQTAGRTLEAQRAYLQALKEDRNYSEAHFNLGLLFADQSEWLEVERSFRAFLAVETNQTQSVAWRYLGEAQWHNRSFDAAQRSLAFAAKLDGRNPEIWNLLGVVETARHHFPEARQNLSYAHYLDPRLASATFNLAVLTHQQFGDRKAAASLFREYLTIAPSAPNAEAVRSLIRQLEAPTSGPATVEPRKSVDSSRPSNSNIVVNPTIPDLPLVAPASPVSPHPPPQATNLASFHTAHEPVPTSIPGSRLTRVSNPPLTSAPPVRFILASNVKTAIPPLIVSNFPTEPSHDVSPTLIANMTNREEMMVFPPPVVVQIRDDPQLGAAPATPSLSIPRDSSTVPLVSNSPSVSPRLASQPIRRPSDAQPPSAPNRPTSPISTNLPTPNQNEEKAGLWSRLNPVRWGNPRRWFSDPSEKEPTYVGEVPPPAFISPASKATASSASLPTIRRYSRSFPDGLTPGDRPAAEARFIAGADAWDSGDRQSALNAYRQAVNADPTYFPAQYNLAVAALAVGDGVTALLAAEAAVIADPLSASAHRVFGSALARRNFPADAAEEFEKYLQLQPSDAEVHLALAGIYANQLGDSARAKVHYERVLTLRPQHPQSAQIQSWLANP